MTRGFVGLVGLVGLVGCATEITINGNGNHVDTSPAKYAGYGSTVDVLKGMSLPSLSLGGKEEKDAEEEKSALPVQGETKNDGSCESAVVETPKASVTEDKVVVKEQKENE